MSRSFPPLCCFLRCDGRCVGEIEREKYPKCVVSKLPETDSCKYSEQSTCDADALCTWCKCAAVPSSCYLITDAKKLPPSVFACDKL